MRIKSLEIKNFRNYKFEKIYPNEGTNVLLGKNAQGKTNIIEAIYLCCVGRSHRTNKDEEMIKWDSEFCKVEVISEQNDGSHQISMVIAKGQKKKKNVKIGGRQAEKIGEMMGHVCGIIFSPEDLQLVKGSPSERRRYLDIILSQINPLYFYSLQRYHNVLVQRNALLRQISNYPSKVKTLEMWDDLLIENGKIIAQIRKKAIENLSEISFFEHQYLTDNKEILKLRYITQIKNIENYEESFRKLLIESREEDVKRQSTGIGIHRDDIGIRINDKEAKIFGSQGQQRSVVLSLKLAQMEYYYKEKNEYPILLLDDVMSELDPQRRLSLIKRIEKVQTFITCTDKSDLSGSNIGKIFLVDKGKIL